MIQFSNALWFPILLTLYRYTHLHLKTPTCSVWQVTLEDYYFTLYLLLLKNIYIIILVIAQFNRKAKEKILYSLLITAPRRNGVQSI